MSEEGGDLDSLIEGHLAYLDRLVNKGLLLITRAGKEVRSFYSLLLPPFAHGFFLLTWAPFWWLFKKNTCLFLADECKVSLGCVSLYE